MRCSTTDGFHGRSNSTRRRQNSKLRPSPPALGRDQQARTIGLAEPRHLGVAPRGRQLLVEDAGRELRAVAERRAQHLQRLAVRDEHERLLAGVAPAPAPAPAASRARGSAASIASACCRSAASRPGRAPRASAAPDASARRMRSIFCRRATALRRRRACARIASTASRSCQPRASSSAIGMPTRGGSPPMSARRVELVHGGSGVPRARRCLEARLLGKLLRTQQLQQPEEPVRIVFERRRAQEQHVAAEAGDRRDRAPARARRDGPADGAAAAPRPRRADRCPRAPPGRSAAGARSASRARSRRGDARRTD